MNLRAGSSGFYNSSNNAAKTYNWYSTWWFGTTDAGYFQTGPRMKTGMHLHGCLNCFVLFVTAW
jgi:hypothetical protein